jgi:ABC-type amino acid transport substrate-binding protein
VAAAILGADSYRVEFLQHSAPERPQAIGNGSVDLLANGYSRTMERELYIEGFRGLDFSTPYAYTSDTILGERAYVECIEDGFNVIGDLCSQVKICLKEGLRNIDTISLMVPQQHILVLPEISTIVDAFLNQTCNVLIGGHFLESMVKTYTGDLVVSEQSGPGGIEPLAMAVQVGDPVFLDFVNWVAQAVIAAERYGITRENVRNNSDIQLVASTVFGEEYKDMFYNAIAAVGNVAQINNNIDPNVYPLPPQNWPIADSTMGVMYAMPFGATEMGVEPRSDGALMAVMNRGHLRCGIKVHELTCFAQSKMEDNNGPMPSYYGVDVDFCLAVASGVFGSGDNVEFVELENDPQGFLFLNEDTIDVFAGATVNFENDVKEPKTRVGYAFSKPYFYNNTSAYSLMRYVINFVF